MNGTSCVCNPDYNGNFCLNRKCRNFGMDLNSGMDGMKGKGVQDRCICPPGFLGRNCEPVKCVNGANQIYSSLPNEKKISIFASYNEHLVNAWKFGDIGELVCNYTGYWRTFNYNTGSKLLFNATDSYETCKTEVEKWRVPDTCSDDNVNSESGKPFSCQELDMDSLKEIILDSPPNSIESSDYGVFLTKVMNATSNAINSDTSESIPITELLVETIDSSDPYSDILFVINYPVLVGGDDDVTQIKRELSNKRIKLYALFIQTDDSPKDDAYRYLNNLAVASGGVAIRLRNYTELHQFFKLYYSTLVDNDIVAKAFSENQIPGIALNEVYLPSEDHYLLVTNEDISDSGPVNVILLSGSTSEDFISLSFLDKEDQNRNDVDYKQGKFTPFLYSSSNFSVESQIFITFSDLANPAKPIYNGSVIPVPGDCQFQNYKYYVNFPWTCSVSGGLYHVKVHQINEGKNLTRTFPITCLGPSSGDCLNNGRKQDEVCVCPLQWTGAHCELPVCLNEDGDGNAPRIVQSTTNGQHLSKVLGKPANISTPESNAPNDLYKAINFALDTQLTSRSFIIVYTSNPDADLDYDFLIRLAAKRAEIRVITTQSGSFSHTYQTLALIGNGIPVLISEVDDFENVKNRNGNTNCGGKGSPDPYTFCKCDPGFQGIDCSEPICLNGGILDVSFCRCPPLFYGRRCENSFVQLPTTTVTTATTSTAVPSTSVTKLESTSQSTLYTTTQTEGPSTLSTEAPQTVRGVAFVIDVIGSDDYAFNQTTKSIVEYAKAFNNVHWIMLLGNWNVTVRFGFQKYPSSDALATKLSNFWILRKTAQDTKVASLSKTLPFILDSYNQNGDLLQNPRSLNIFYTTQIGLTDDDHPENSLNGLENFTKSSLVFSTFSKNASQTVLDSLNNFSNNVTNVREYYNGLQTMVKETNNNEDAKINNTKPNFKCVYGLQSNVMVVIDRTPTSDVAYQNGYDFLRQFREGFNYIENDEDRCGLNKSDLGAFYKERTAITAFPYYNNVARATAYCPSRYSIFQDYIINGTSNPDFSDKQVKTMGNIINANDCVCNRFDDESTVKYIIWMPRVPGPVNDTFIKYLRINTTNAYHFVVPFYDVVKTTDLFYKILEDQDPPNADHYLLPNAATHDVTSIVSELYNRLCQSAKVDPTAIPPELDEMRFESRQNYFYN
uniref:EGF-like domain-containing protein n=1 Tax=Caenorhabditis japonica TaxID=281687 RepID=A0A8R1HXI9_CAEJA